MRYRRRFSNLVSQAPPGLLEAVWACIATLAAVMLVMHFVRQPWWSTPTTAVYRVYRAGLLAGVVLGSVALWANAVAQWRGGVWGERLGRWGLRLSGRRALRFWAVLSWLSLGAALLPPFPDFLGLPQWKYALLFWRWLAVVSAGALGLKVWHVRPRLAFPEWRGAVVALGSVAAGVVFLVWTGLGWRFPAYWQGPGVPLLSGQMWLLLTLLGVIGFGVARMAPSGGGWRRYGDAVVFLLLWVVAFVVWAKAVPQPSYFQPRAFPPNEQMYPFSDAEIFGLSAAEGMLGYGYGNRSWYPRGSPVPPHGGMIGVLALLWALTGSFAGAGVGLLLLISLTPPLLYLLGTWVHSRGSGLLLAGAAILREWNVITHANILYAASHARTWTTEPLMREIFVALVLAFLFFARAPWRRRFWLFAVGALLGFGYLVRRENLALIALSPLVVLWLGMRLPRGLPWRQKVGRVVAWVLLLAAGMVGALGGWHYRAAVLSQRLPIKQGAFDGVRMFWTNGFDSILHPGFRANVFSASAAPSTPLPTRVPSPTATPSPSTTSIVAPSPTPTAAVSPSSTPTAVPLLTPTATAPLSATPTPTSTPLPPSAPLTTKLLHWRGDLIVGVLNLFARNLIALAFTLPASWGFYPLPDVLRAEGSPWWHVLEAPWYHFSLPLTLLLAFNLGIAALGWGGIWRRQRTAAIFPLLLAGLYLGTTSVARDCGGRYIVPFDWVLLLFYVAGWIVLWREGARGVGLAWPAWLVEGVSPPEDRFSRRAPWMVGGGVVALSLAMVALEFAAMGWVVYSGQDGLITWEVSSPPRWRPATAMDIVARLDKTQAWETLPWSRKEVVIALKKQKVYAAWGHMFFPRYVQDTAVCGDLCRGFALSQPTLFFDALVGGRGAMYFYQPLAFSPPPMADGTEVIVFFCNTPQSQMKRYPALAVLWFQRAPRTGKPSLGGVLLPPEATLGCGQ